MDIRPIHTEADHKATLKEISALMESNPELGTPEGDRLYILVKRQLLSSTSEVKYP